MPVYFGRNVNLTRLADTDMTQAAFDIVAAVGFSTMRKYLVDGADRVLKRQLSIFFNRCPDLFTEFQTKCILENPDVEPEYFDKAITIDYIVHDEYSFFHEVIRNEAIDRYVIVEYCAPVLLRTLISKIREDDLPYEYAHSFVGLCRNYFDEIDEYISYLEL